MQSSTSLFKTLVVLGCVLCGASHYAAGALAPVQERINTALGRELFVEASSIPGKVHEWKDIKKWVPVRKNSTLTMPYPEKLKGSGISEVITVKLIITPEGQVINPMIEDLKNKDLALPAILHAAGLKFEIPRINKEPVYLTQKVKLICSEDPQFGQKK